MVKKKTLKVIGAQPMHCSGCERTVTFALSNLPGVKITKVDHQTQLIEIVLINDETSLEKVKDELNWIGYEVAEV